MKNSAQPKLPLSPTRPAYRTLRGWGLGILMEQGAVAECDHHGHRRDLGDPDAWHRAREQARNAPFSGASGEDCVAVIDEVMRSLGDTCPDCG